ncbi:pentapeptide repeat-containing protein [Hafnia alvei]|uniref:pentapeptide repeat-containing protein n=1 Tax=Hafnia alvei TaxID=569 RepID=UPI001E4B3F72|nr:pentapeptide repeat-containing protein [Hafnia alvei]
MSKLTQEELNTILEAHNTYLTSFGKEGEKANLFEKDLSGLDLRSANLSYADLRSANLPDETFIVMGVLCNHYL